MEDDTLAEEEKDTLEESPTSDETTETHGEGDPEEKPNVAEELLEINKSLEGLKQEREKLQKEVGDLRLERRVYRSQKPAEKAEEGDTTEPKEGAPKSDLERFKEAQRTKARKAFIKRHPEYGTLEADAMFDTLDSTYERVRSNTDMDADEILEDMETAWAVEHRDDILKKSKDAKRKSIEDDMSVADLASGGSGGGAPRSSVKATASDYRSAKIAKMSIEKYMQLKPELEAIEFS